MSAPLRKLSEVVTTGFAPVWFFIQMDSFMALQGLLARECLRARSASEFFFSGVNPENVGLIVLLFVPIKKDEKEKNQENVTVGGLSSSLSVGK